MAQGYLTLERKVSGPHLVVVPLSVLPNWITEFKRFCPDLRVVRLHVNDEGARDGDAAAGRQQRAARALGARQRRRQMCLPALGAASGAQASGGDGHALADCGWVWR